VKQDRVAPRTVDDLERKYSFGKRFSEILGLIDETQEKVDETASSLRNDITKSETSIRRDTEQIVMDAKRDIQKTVDGNIESLTNQVTAQITAEAAKITVLEEKLEAGAEKVVTKTGYTFDADGLKISKSGEEMENTLDNTGMYVKRNGENILIANNEGVEATDVHIKTYLIIGEGDGRSRFEDYGTNRTGCFWIGG
jgi:hypothetical protein